MDKTILKLLPQKAFKLISIKETFKISTAVTKSVFDRMAYEENFQRRVEGWKFEDIELVKEISLSKANLYTKKNGEKILKIYFSQFFEKNLAVHIDLRKNSFSAERTLSWTPSKISYSFSQKFLEGVCSLYTGFYFDDSNKFENGLIKLGMIKESMSEKQKNDMKELFFTHFGEGRTAAVKFSIKNLQDSFNAIFSHFLKEDIPLNPEFAVLGVTIVTLYLTLQDIPYALNVRDAFIEVVQKYQKI